MATSLKESVFQVTGALGNAGESVDQLWEAVIVVSEGLWGGFALWTGGQSSGQLWLLEAPELVWGLLSDPWMACRLSVGAHSHPPRPTPNCHPVSSPSPIPLITAKSDWVWQFTNCCPSEGHTAVPHFLTVLPSGLTFTTAPSSRPH